MDAIKNGDGEPFKTCPCCGSEWQTREEMLQDPEVEAIGYQVNFAELVLGLLLFNHLGCGGTYACHVQAMADLHDGPIYEDRLTSTSDCPSYCLREDELRPCPNQCECAFVRAVLDKMANWPKRAP